MSDVEACQVWLCHGETPSGTVNCSVIPLAGHFTDSSCCYPVATARFAVVFAVVFAFSLLALSRFTFLQQHNVIPHPSMATISKMTPAANKMSGGMENDGPVPVPGAPFFAHSFLRGL